MPVVQEGPRLVVERFVAVLADVSLEVTILAVFGDVSAGAACDAARTGPPYSLETVRQRRPHWPNSTIRDSRELGPSRFALSLCFWVVLYDTEMRENYPL